MQRIPMLKVTGSARSFVVTPPDDTADEGFAAGLQYDSPVLIPAPHLRIRSAGMSTS